MTEFATKVENEMTYVSYWPIVQALYPEAVAVWNNGQAEVTAPGLKLQIAPGAKYIVANGRYLYVPDGVKLENGVVLVPVRTLCQALGAKVVWNGAESVIEITSGSGPIASGDSFYDQEDLYWLSRIITLRAATSLWRVRSLWATWCSTVWPALSSPTRSTA